MVTAAMFTRRPTNSWLGSSMRMRRHRPTYFGLGLKYSTAHTARARRYAQSICTRPIDLAHSARDRHSAMYKKCRTKQEATRFHAGSSRPTAHEIRFTQSKTEKWPYRTRDIYMTPRIPRTVCRYFWAYPFFSLCSSCSPLLVVSACRLILLM